MTERVDARPNPFAILAEEFRANGDASIILDATDAATLMEDVTYISSAESLGNNSGITPEVHSRVVFEQYKGLPTLNAVTDITFHTSLMGQKTSASMQTDSALVSDTDGILEHIRPMKLDLTHNGWMIQFQKGDKKTRDSWGKDPNTPTAWTVYGNIYEQGLAIEPEDILFDVTAEGGLRVSLYPPDASISAAM